MLTTNNLETSVNDEWEPKAWVYFIWLVLSNHIYCKVGHSVDPMSRYQQIAAGMPEQPYRMHVLSCFSQEQARLFESMFHSHLDEYRSRGEWFSHANAKHLHKVIQQKIEEIATLFFTFGYQPELEAIELGGYQPVLYPNGFISHVVPGSAENND